MCSRSSSSRVTGRPTLMAGSGAGALAIVGWATRSGKSLAASRRPTGEDHGPLDGVAQLAEVARPGVRDDGLARLGAKPLDLLADLPSEKRQQVLGQLDAVGPFPQRRARSARHVEPEQEVVAKFARGDGRIEIAVGGGDQPHVGRAGARFADAFVALLFEKAEQLGLKLEGQLADLVEEQSAPLGRGDLALGIGDSSGERAAGMAEERAFEQFGAQARAAHRDKGPLGPAAPGVDRPRQHALARAALSPDQHDRVGRRDMPRLVEHQNDLGVIAFQQHFGRIAAELFLQIGQLAVQRSRAARRARRARGSARA